jgi:hypothetical protein
MTVRVATPTYNPQKKCHEIVITDGPGVEGGSEYPYQIDFIKNKDILDKFIQELLASTSQYFSKPLELEVFFQRLVHSYSTDDDLAGVTIKSIYWIPASVVFYPSRYEIQWRPLDIEVADKGTSGAPGNELLESDVLPSDKPAREVKVIPESAQKRLRQKVRQARLKCALARVHVERMTEKYYSKYGTFDGFSDSDSELSSDFEFNPNEAPRKI